MQFASVTSNQALVWWASGAITVILLGLASLWLVKRNKIHKKASNQPAVDMLHTKNQQADIIIQSITDGVVAFDNNGKITLMNPAAGQLTQWAPNDAIGIDVRLVMKFDSEEGKPLEKGSDLFDQVLNQKKQLKQDLQLTGQQGQRTVISLAISPITLDSSQSISGAVAVFRDITKEHQAEQQRIDFISTASHEMRTPVAAIEGFLALALNDKVSKIDDTARSYLDKAHRSATHLGELFRDLLTSANAEDGRLSSHNVVVEIGELVDQLLEELRPSAKEKNLKVDLAIGGNEPSEEGARVIQPLYYVWADPSRIREILTNLFDNAVKYTDHGSIKLGLTGNDEVVQIYVKDTGIGIPAEDVPHLFQKFYRVDNSTTRIVGGTGLGLFISRKIVELYSGRIWAESELGKGSTFFVNLPRISTQRAEQLDSNEPTNSESVLAEK